MKVMRKSAGVIALLAGLLTMVGGLNQAQADGPSAITLTCPPPVPGGTLSLTATVTDSVDPVPNGGSTTYRVAVALPTIDPADLPIPIPVNNIVVTFPIASGVTVTSLDPEPAPAVGGLTASVSGSNVLVTTGSFTLTPGGAAATIVVDVTVSVGGFPDGGSVQLTTPSAVNINATLGGNPLPLACTNANPGAALATTTVSPDPEAPSAADDTLALTGGAASGTVDVLANDSDPDTTNADLSVAVTAAPAVGSTSVSGADVTFTLPAATSRESAICTAGSTSFNYTVTDPTGLTDTASVNVSWEASDTAACSNEAPSAVDDEVANADDGEGNPVPLGSDTSIVGSVGDNDSDPNDGDTLTFALETDSADGTVTMADDGTFTFEPDAPTSADSPLCDAGSTTFTYTVSDQLNATDTATVTISWAAGWDTESAERAGCDNVAPTASDVSLALTDLTGTATLAGDDANLAEDGSTEVLGYSLTSEPSVGTVALDGNEITYTLPTPADTEGAACSDGTDTITYTVTDQFGATADATVNVSWTGLTTGNCATQVAGTNTTNTTTTNTPVATPQATPAATTAATVPATGSENRNMIILGVGLMLAGACFMLESNALAARRES